MAVLAEILKSSTARLSEALDLAGREARLEAQVLAAHALGVGRAWLVAHDRDEPSSDQTQAIEALIARRTQGEPIAYILGEREFYGRMFKVSPDVLIPRPDTELLVESALSVLPEDGAARVLDLGTGSGCIAISLALARPRAMLWAVDNSAHALAMAEENSRRLGAAIIHFLLGSWCEPLDGQDFDLIVSNPPYIVASDPHLHKGGLPHEPQSALTPGQDGLAAIRLILAQATRHLRPGGMLMLEHGHDQGDACRDLFSQAGYCEIATLCDLAGLDRVTLGKLH